MPNTPKCGVYVSTRILERRAESRADGRGIRNLMITITGGSGETRTVISSAFGYYRFADVAAGETYIFTVRAKRFTFSHPTPVLSILEDTDDVIFTANN